MKNLKSNTGFTLIELLVVIAIIGILSSVVMASLNVARNKGADAAVKANMSTIKAQAEIYYDGSGNYGADILDCAGGAMFADPNIVNALAQVTVNAATGATQACNTDTNGQKWATSISALKGAGTSWCIDSSGWNKAGLAAAGICA